MHGSQSPNPLAGHHMTPKPPASLTDWSLSRRISRIISFSSSHPYPGIPQERRFLRLFRVSPVSQAVSVLPVRRVLTSSYLSPPSHTTPHISPHLLIFKHLLCLV